MINFWSQHEVLLNVKHPNYWDKDCGINVLNRIAEALKDHDMNFSAEEISSKMHSLRVYFSAQRNKLILFKRSGAGTEDVHKVNWPFYEPLMFLNDHLVSCSTEPNMTQNHLTSENDTAKEFLKLDIHRAIITAIHHNNGPHNPTVPVRQVGNSPSFAGVIFFHQL